MKMDFVKVVFMVSVMAMAGCKNTPVRNSDADIDRSAELEGSKHRVWKEKSYKGIRSELKEGEYIVFRNVYAEKDYHGEYYYLGDVYSEDGYKLFDKKYTLSDLGVISAKDITLDKSIDPELTIVPRGTLYHGSNKIHDSFSTTYWKSTGGDNPKATPVRDYYSRTTNSKKTAEEQFSDLYIQCINNQTFLSYSNYDKVYAANNEEILISVYHPYSSVQSYKSRSVGNSGFSLKVDSKINNILLNEDAIKIEAYSLANRKFIEITAYNNGLAEAYLRVKNLCEK